jgi:hypothetical protein
MARTDFKSVDGYISKGTLRFPLSQPVPVKLIERIAVQSGRNAAECAGEDGPKVEESPKSGGRP